MTFNRYSLDLEASSSQYAYVADNAALSITGDISIEAWIKLEQLPSTAGADFGIVVKDDSAGGGSYRFWINDADNKLYFISTNDGTFGAGGQIQYVMDTAFVAGEIGKWIHVAVSVDVDGSPKCVFYKNGTSMSATANQTGGTSIYDGTTAFCIGARKNATPDYYFDGMLNNVRVWSDIRSGAEILANMYTVLTGTSNNLVGSWYATANNHNDLAGTNNLTAVNTPVFSTNVPWTGANSTDWSTSYQIKADNTKVSGASDLTNFPVLIKDGNIPASIYSAMQATGADLRITTDSAGTTEIPFEIVSITPGSSLAEVWAKVPTLLTASATSLYLWAGNANAVAYDANAPFGSQNVWGSEYKRVLHLQETVNNDSGGYKDSTSNAGHGTGTSMALTAPAGQIGISQDFDGSADYITLTDSADLEQASGSLAFWFKPDATLDSGLGRIYYLTDKGNTYLGVRITNVASNQGKLDFILYDGSTHRVLTSQASWTGGTWYHFTGTWGASGMKVYINGAADGTDAHTGGYTNVADNVRIAGNTAGTTTLWDGKIDEWRIVSSQKTADWVATEYNNQNSPSTFWITSTAYTSTLTETVTLVDTLIKSESRTLTDTATAVDTVVKSISRSLLDYLTLIDSVLKGPERTLTDSSTPSDSVIKETNRTLTDVVTPSDSILRSIARTLTDSLTPSDSIEKLLNRLTSSIPTTLRHLANIKPFGFGKSVSEPRPSLKDNNKPSMM